MPHIKVRTMNNREQVIDYEETDTIKDLKKKIMEKEGISVEQFKLILNGEQTNENVEIQKYRFKNPNKEDVFMIVSVLKGG